MTDKELLEYAAKAAGIKIPTKEDYPYAYIDHHGIHRDISCGGDGTRMSHWNPLTDDGDAFKLMVQLRLGTLFPKGIGRDRVNVKGHTESLALNDPLAATRRAIVRAAAEIGRSMK